jgi:hypothetical protein
MKRLGIAVASIAASTATMAVRYPMLACAPSGPGLTGRAHLNQARGVGQAVTVHGEQISGAGLRQGGSGCVFVGQQRFQAGRPGDGDLGVKGVDAVFTGRGVRSGAQVEDRRMIAQRDEGVSKPFLNEDGPPRRAVELDRGPAAVCRRSHSQIDDHIEDGTGQAGNVLRLAGRDICEMNPSDDPAPRYRAVGLGDVWTVPEAALEVALAEPFEKASPDVLMNTWRKNPCPVDIESLHAETVDGPRRASQRTRATSQADHLVLGDPLRHARCAS